MVAPLEYAIVGKNKPLNFDLAARVRKASSQQMVWEFELAASNTTPDVIGGGISFKLNLPQHLSSVSRSCFAGNRGWVWGRAGGKRMEMRFRSSHGLGLFRARSEKRNTDILLQGRGVTGSKAARRDIRRTGDVAIGPSVPERFGPEDLEAWPTNIMDWRTSPVDLSFLNDLEKPAGKRGFVKAAHDELVFEDGTTARFWGTNLTAYSLFGTIRREDVTQTARRLSQLGSNLVRLTHNDSPWVNPNVFGDKASNTKTVSDAILERLDWWIKCLKDEGIYIFLDLHVQRHLKPGDGIEDFEEISKGKPEADLKGFNYINASIQEAMQRFNAAYVTHVNQFTGLRYKDDPAIIAMLLTNENDVTHHFGNALLPDKKVPKHNALYMAQAEKFAYPAWIGKGSDVALVGTWPVQALPE